jgi:hypothetical protein
MFPNMIAASPIKVMDRTFTMGLSQDDGFATTNAPRARGGSKSSPALMKTGFSIMNTAPPMEPVVEKQFMSHKDDPEWQSHRMDNSVDRYKSASATGTLVPSGHPVNGSYRRNVTGPISRNEWRRIRTNDPSKKAIILNDLKFEREALFKLSHHGAKQLAASMSRNNVATEVNLSGNNIGDAGCQGFAIAIAHQEHSALRKVNFSDNNINDHGAKALAELLSKNSTIRHLDISGNKITAEGAGRLAEALANSDSIVTFNILDNRIGADGFMAFLAALEQNPRLRKKPCHIRFGDFHVAD